MRKLGARNAGVACDSMRACSRAVVHSISLFVLACHISVLPKTLALCKPRWCPLRQDLAAPVRLKGSPAALPPYANYTRPADCPLLIPKTCTFFLPIVTPYFPSLQTMFRARKTPLPVQNRAYYTTRPISSAHLANDTDDLARFRGSSSRASAPSLGKRAPVANNDNGSNKKKRPPPPPPRQSSPIDPPPPPIRSLHGLTLNIRGMTPDKWESKNYLFVNS